MRAEINSPRPEVPLTHPMFLPLQMLRPQERGVTRRGRIAIPSGVKSIWLASDELPRRPATARRFRG